MVDRAAQLVGHGGDDRVVPHIADPDIDRVGTHQFGGVWPQDTPGRIGPSRRYGDRVEQAGIEEGAYLSLPDPGPARCLLAAAQDREGVAVLANKPRDALIAFFLLLEPQPDIGTGGVGVTHLTGTVATKKCGIIAGLNPSLS
jgi:hypothetical protein